MKKKAVGIFTTSIAISSLLFASVYAETNEEPAETTEITAPEQQTVTPQVNDESTLYTDTEALEEVNENLAETETFEVVDGIEVKKEEEGVTVGVTETGDLQIEITDTEKLNEIDEQIQDTTEEIYTEDGIAEPVITEPEEGELIGYSLLIPEEQINAYLDTEEAVIAEDNSTQTEDATMDALWGSGLYLKNKKSTYSDGDIIRASSYEGKAKAKMVISEAIALGFSGLGGMPIKTVTAELGFTYSKTKTVTDEYEVTVPSGKTYRIYAKEYNRNYNFEVWNDPYFGGDEKVSSGKVKRPIGVSFSKREI